MGKNTKTETRMSKGRSIRGAKKEVRRNLRNKKVHAHWKFKNSHINHKFEKKQKKLLHQNPKNQIQKQEEEIVEIENENDLFDANGNVDPKDVDATLLEWDDENETNNAPNMNEIISKMNEVNEKKLEPKVVEAYKLVGEVLRAYTSGKLPKAFSILPGCQNWEELVNITEPYNWTPQAMYEDTVLFSSNFDPVYAEKFYEKYLLPAIRSDIRKNKKLNIHYYNSLKKSLFKPAAFFKGIILTLSKSLSSREAGIIGSILRKCSIPSEHGSAALMKLMQYCKEGRNGISIGAVFFMKILLLKKYAIPQQVKEGLVNFFLSYENYKGKIPVMWYQLFLVFVQQYKLGLSEQDKEKLRALNRKLEHHLISSEIAKELNYVKGGPVHSAKGTNQMEIE